MDQLTLISEIRSRVTTYRNNGASVGFVPTMGYLHEGHLALVQRARNENSFVVVSVFVNPTQFGPAEDFDDYPRDLDRDRCLLEEAGVDVLFAPPTHEMYPDPLETFVECPGLGVILEGAVRPIYFRGVATVVAKLFNIVQPDLAYFGEKDFQQVAVIRQMVKDLSIPVEIVAVPTVRDKNGLALSSRNAYLSPEEKEAAFILFKSLKMAEKAVHAGVSDPLSLESKLRSMISSEPRAKIDMIAVRNADTLQTINGEIPSRVLILLFVQFGAAQLLDHIVVESVKQTRD